MPPFPDGHDEVLHAEGLTGCSLATQAGEIWLPYDIGRTANAPEDLSQLKDPRVQCAAQAPLAIDWNQVHEAHILNGMGVALGDNIIGLSVVHELVRRHPQLTVILHPAATLPTAVTQLQALVEHERIRIQALPIRLDAIPRSALIIDLGDFAYWSEFDTLPMVDFFAWTLGLDTSQLAAPTRRNAWLRDLPALQQSEPCHATPFVLFAPHASSPLRAIPERLRVRFVDALARHHAQPILGFGAVAHPAYTDIGAYSRNTAEFMAWIAHATLLVSADSAAIHVAAGFDIPTLAGFVSIDPALRIAGYPHCRPCDLRCPALNGLHHSADTALLELAAQQWEKFAGFLQGDMQNGG